MRRVLTARFESEDCFHTNITRLDNMLSSANIPHKIYLNGICKDQPKCCTHYLGYGEEYYLELDRGRSTWEQVKSIVNQHFRPIYQFRSDICYNEKHKEFYVDCGTIHM